MMRPPFKVAFYVKSRSEVATPALEAAPVAGEVRFCEALHYVGAIAGYVCELDRAGAVDVGAVRRVVFWETFERGGDVAVLFRVSHVGRPSFR
jgi:hypothetical protein